MRVNDFLTDLGDMLQEDYVTSPVWTKAEVFGYVRQTLKTFCQLTQLIDRHENRLVNGTDGGVSMPEDFDQLYMVQFSQLMKDIVTVEEFDFAQDGWLSDVKGVPMASTVVGSGGSATVGFAPVPSSVYDGGVSPGTTLTVRLDSGTDEWLLTVTAGVLSTAISAGAASTLVIAGPSTYWDLGITVAGQLTLTASASTSADTVILQDAGSTHLHWEVESSDSGELITGASGGQYGLGVAAILDTTTYQDFDQEYGIIVDAYADSVSSTPADVVKVNSPVGVSLVGRSGDEAATVWYKGSHRDLGSYYNDIWLSDGLMPVLKHGVLALAFGHDGDGRDVEKAELMKNIFFAECTSIRGIFESRWE